ncbi:MAG: hypothetical protein HN742_14270 [Lentisphaerae bacterium]|nr:hypothetical protein [Lentisphaerota bacterium]MBT4818262.1 hypothetical protein [Lentisphaerota bacterium]MBT5606634.1 hypothetical protein [Lentisphaerota bacterium]MBT7059523.1 hypothetical protein [Lentisphaerota bacterium]MBT7843040.1 hypothetical protein [Lentisphaerota bacterium]
MNHKLWQKLVRGRAARLMSVITALTILSHGCKTASTSAPPKAGEERAPAQAPLSIGRSTGPTGTVLEDTPLIVDEVAPPEQSGEDKFVFPERQVRETTKPKFDEYPDKLIKGIEDADATVHVTFQLDTPPTLTEIVELFATTLNFSYLIDSSVNAKGSVDLQVDDDMTAREAWQTFEHVLWLMGCYASRNPGFIHILPFSKMAKERRLLVEHEPMANVEVAFIPIMYVKSSEIIANVQPFMTDDATITDIQRTNSLLIVEAPANMEKIRELIRRLDTKGEAEWPHMCLHCHHMDAEELQAELEALLPILGLPVTAQPPSGGQIKLTSIPRLQVIIVSAALQDVLTEVADWCRFLDREDQAEKENIFFYNVQHSTATQLEEVLTFFFDTQSAKSAKTSKTKSTSAKATGPGSSTTSQRTPTKTNTTSRRRTTTSGEKPETIFDTPVYAFVDEVQNRLTIRTTHRAYALVKALLERHDVPQRQVMIEAIIADITLGESTEFGFAYAAKHGSASNYGTFGFNQTTSADVFSNTTTTGTTTTSTVGPPDGRLVGVGATALGLLKGDKMAYITAIAGETNTRVISAPQIMAASDEEAVINVGRRVSIRTSEYGDNSSYSRANYQYEDTGTILTVTPHITAGNEVRLDIQQEVSSVVPDTGSADQSPDISNKQLQTTLIIPDGDTVMMGGLIDTDSSDGHSGIPYLKDIPGIGHLFRTNSKSTSRHELIVLITVQVIDGDKGTDALAHRYQAALQEIRERLDR